MKDFNREGYMYVLTVMFNNGSAIYTPFTSLLSWEK